MTGSFAARQRHSSKVLILAYQPIINQMEWDAVWKRKVKAFHLQSEKPSPIAAQDCIALGARVGSCVLYRILCIEKKAKIRELKNPS